MADFLTTKGFASELENILRKAKKEIILVSPYLQLSKNFIERLEEASNNGVKITLIYGKAELKEDVEDILSGLNNFSAYFYKDLHAKCYANESQLIIGSMNLYEYSEQHNREMGVLISKTKDGDVFREALAEVASIVKNSEERVFEEYEEVGFCIRCGVEIPFNPEKPFCLKCYRQYKNEEEQYWEEYCHSCGKKKRKIEFENPLCRACS